jgi:hypothetical protein
VIKGGFKRGGGCLLRLDSVAFAQSWWDEGGSHPHGGVVGVVNGRESNFDNAVCTDSNPLVRSILR